MINEGKKEMINEEKKKKNFRGVVVFAINEKEKNKKKKNLTGRVVFVINEKKKRKKN